MGGKCIEGKFACCVWKQAYVKMSVVGVHITDKSCSGEINTSNKSCFFEPGQNVFVGTELVLVSIFKLAGLLKRPDVSA